MESSHDTLALLLMIRIMQDMREQASSRASHTYTSTHAHTPSQPHPLPFYTSFLDGLSILLWPRFKALLDAHVCSLRQASTPALLLQVCA